MSRTFADTAAKVCRLKALLSELENGMVELAEQLNAGGCDYCGNEGYNTMYAETAAIDRQIDSMLVFSANVESLALA